MEEILRSGLTELGVAFPEEAPERLRRYYELLSQRNQVMNLTAIEGEEPTARLHFLDSAAVLTQVPLSGKTVCDVGSGAGFPGLVLKALCPDMSLTLLDSLQKRVAFQQEAAEAMGFSDVRYIAGRAEEQTELRASFDVVTSRAVARLRILTELCLPLVKKGGVFVAMKGPEPEEEMVEAARCIGMLGGGDTELVKYTVPGTDAVHSLVIIRKVSSTPPRYPRRFALIKKQPL